jgi:hypothetical protein
MSVSPISSLLAGPLTASAAVGTQNSLLHTTIGERTIKDHIDLSKEAISLIAAGGTPAAK